MRMSTAQIFRDGITTVLQQQANLAQVQQQLGSGKRIQRLSDDPVGVVKALDIKDDIAQTAQYQRNSDTASTQLALEESVLGKVGNVLQRVRELIVKANNATQTPQTRQIIATEVKSRMDELLSLANTRDASDEFIFAGFQSLTQPFTREGGVVQYNGDNGERALALADNSSVKVRDSGQAVFLSSPSGNGVFEVTGNAANTGTAVAGARSVNGSFVADNYTLSFQQPVAPGPITYEVRDGAAALVSSGNYVSGESINMGGAVLKIEGTPADGDQFAVTPAQPTNMFAGLAKVVETLEGATGTAANSARLATALTGSLEALDQSLEHVLKVRTDVGTRMNHVESQEELRGFYEVELNKNLSAIEDLDYAEAISRMNMQLTALQAAQQTFVKTQGLSLFNYIS